MSPPLPDTHAHLADAEACTSPRQRPRTEAQALAAACDVQGMALLQAGAFDDALVAFRRAAAVTPHALARLQNLGLLAAYLGQHDIALPALTAAVARWGANRPVDPQCVLMLAFLRFDQGDRKGLLRCQHVLQEMARREPDSPSVRRRGLIAEILLVQHLGNQAEVVTLLRAMVPGFERADHDALDSVNMAALLTRLACRGVDLPDAAWWLQRLALRTCVSQPISKLMAEVVRAHPPYVELVRKCEAFIEGLAARALQQARGGAPDSGVRSLLAQGARLLNARLLYLADVMLTRHRHDISDADGLAEMVADMRARYGRTEAAQLRLAGTSA